MIKPGYGPALCPFHDGPETLDGLLAEIDPENVRLIDAVLDLRFLLREGGDLAAAMRQVFVVRSLLEERHYLAFYRVRRWLGRTVHIEYRGGPGEAWSAAALPLGAARIEEVAHACGAALAQGGEYPPRLEVRFAHSESLQATSA